MPTINDFEDIQIELKEYFVELVQVINRRHEECKIILEKYFRQEIQRKRDSLMETGNYEDQQNAQGVFSEITEQHGILLAKLRDNFENFLQFVESEHCEASDKMSRFQLEIQSNLDQSESI